MARSQSNSIPVRVRCNEFELDAVNAWLLQNGRAVARAPTPFNLRRAPPPDSDAAATAT